jgi:ribonuclease D
VSALEDIARVARSTGRLGLDTEFMGEGRYRTQLCLIQLTTTDPHGAQRIEVLDPLAEDIDIRPLAALLDDAAVEIVVHAGRQDIALLRRHLGCQVRNLFDTQVAAGFTGLPAQCSYETLLAQTLGTRVHKTASFTRWDSRPLSDEQLSYAREDVEHLLALAEELERRLRAAGRLQWAREECAYLETVSDERDLDAVFEKLPRIRGLNAAARAVALELVRWREQTAQERNKPVQSVLGDAVLVEIAKRKPASREQLHEIRGVANSSLQRRSAELLDTVRRGLERPPLPVAEQPRSAPADASDAPLVALCESLVRARAREAGLAYELLASRADLQAIVTAHRQARAARTELRVGVISRDGDPDAGVRTVRGWRRELVGDQLLDLLDGRLALSVADGSVDVAAASDGAAA